MNFIISILFFLLVTTIQSYNASTALELAYMSKIAYRNVSNIKAWNCDICDKYKLQNPQAFNNDNSQGFVGYSPTLDAIILSIRGSKNIDNWIKNAKFSQTTYSGCNGCKVHSGFSEAYKAIKSSIITQIQNSRNTYKDKKIYVTGHSLGGAIAVLATVDIKNQFGNVVQVLTFGQPKVGNSQFVSWFGQLATHERVVYNGDPVPHLPPKLLGYSHSGREIWYSKGFQTYKICEQGNYKNCSVPVTKITLSDHSTNNYITIKVDSTLAHMLSLRVSN